MAGPGIRYHYMAETLSRDFDVTVGFFAPNYLPDDAFERSYGVRSINVHHFEKDFEPFDYVIALWLSEAIVNYCTEKKKVVVFDIYAPVPVESMAVHIFSGKKPTKDVDFVYEKSIHDYHQFLRTGDAFLYSNRRQLDFWQGFAFGTGEITPSLFTKRNVFDQFILAPMGIDTSTSLDVTKPMYKGVIKGIAKDDIVIIWNGGIYDWYDGISLIKAMKIVRQKNKRIKLVFPGLTHPNGSLPKWKETTDTVALSSELGLTGKNVFFFDKWIDYHERVAFLAEADAAIYTHKPSIEGEFSHRTRVLDHILAKLPTVATDGDYFAELVRDHDLGVVAKPEDPEDIARAILEVADTKNAKRYRKNIEKVRDSFDWQATMQNLREYLLSEPKKVYQAPALQKSSKKSRVYGIGKRYLPLPVKKAIVRVTPSQVKRRFIK